MLMLLIAITIFVRFAISSFVLSEGSCDRPVKDCTRNVVSIAEKSAIWVGHSVVLSHGKSVKAYEYQ